MVHSSLFGVVKKYGSREGDQEKTGNKDMQILLLAQVEM